MGATMNFNLYYLCDQSGCIDGPKTLQGSYGDLVSAQNQATEDNVQHYSVEKNDGSENFTVVFIQ